jgi:uncharacterized protein (DUF4415 family)
MRKKSLIDKNGEVEELTAADMKRFKPLKEADPALYSMIKKQRGRPPLEKRKAQLTVRLDADVVEWLKSNGAGYHTRLNALLRQAMES